MRDVCKSSKRANRNQMHRAKCLDLHVCPTCGSSFGVLSCISGSDRPPLNAWLAHNTCLLHAVPPACTGLADGVANNTSSYAYISLRSCSLSLSSVSRAADSTARAKKDPGRRCRVPRTPLQISNFSQSQRPTRHCSSFDN